MLFFFPEYAHWTKATFLYYGRDFFRKVFWEAMDNREKTGIKRGDAIDQLLEIKKSSSESKLILFLNF